MSPRSDSDSDSSQPPGDTAQELPAYEFKFPVDDALATQVAQWARLNLTTDPHADPSLGGSYLTTTLYCDTPEGDVYHRCPSYRRRKFRIRRYGLATAVFLERKIKTGDQVRKRRTLVPESELTVLDQPTWIESWPGAWFAGRVRHRRLVPAACVTYERLAFVGSCSEGPLRLTIDRNLRGEPADRWQLGPFARGLPLLPGRAIVELKFVDALPRPFKELVQSFQLSAQRISKYRMCRDAWSNRVSADMNGMNGDAACA